MNPRSFLFVPGDSEKKLEKATRLEADALILDLEDAVASERLADARRLVASLLNSHPDRSRQQLWVRIGELGSEQALEDLAAVVAGEPDGIVLPKSGSGNDVTHLDHLLSALEVREGLERGSIRILAIASETAASVFRLGTYDGCSTRLHGITWGSQDLAAAVGAASTESEDGSGPADLFRLARSLCLAGARAAGVEPVDGVFPNYRDLDGLRTETRAAMREGWSAKIAIHPAQVPVIHEALRPSEEEIVLARAIVAAFESSPEKGAVGLEGQMLDRPHLRQAQRVLDLIRVDRSSA